MCTRAKGAERGVTLIEVVVALAILVLIGFGVSVLFHTTSRVQQSANARDNLNSSSLQILGDLKAQLRFVDRASPPTAATCGGANCRIVRLTTTGQDIFQYSSACAAAPAQLARFNVGVAMTVAPTIPACGTGQRPVVTVRRTQPSGVVTTQTYPAAGEASLGGTQGVLGAQMQFQYNAGPPARVNVQTAQYVQALDERVTEVRNDVTMQVGNSSNIQIIK